MRKVALGLAALVLLFAGTQLSSAQPAPGVSNFNFIAPPPGSTRVLALGGFGEMATDVVFSSGDLSGTSTRQYDFNAFNAMTPVQLRASYDVIVVTWGLDTAFDLDWTTRLRPYLDLGGSVIWEDYANIGDLAPGVIAFELNAADPYTFTTSVPGLTDGIVGLFENRHTAFSSWDPALHVFMKSNSDTIGLYGEFPSGGRIVLTGPDQDYHSIRPSDQYNFLVNELRWVSPSLISQLKVHVQALITAGTLTKSYGNLLISLLDSARLRVDQGRNPAAITLLKSFISYVQKAPLPPGDKAALIAEANAIILFLSGNPGN